MQNITRRNFLRVAAATSAASVLAACGQSQEPTEEPAEEGGEEPAEPAGDGSYPIEPEELGSGDVKWSEEDVDSHKLVTQEGGATLSYSPESGLALIQVDGYVFKDLNGNGKLDLFEDWRQPAADRAADWAAQLSVEDELPLMLHASTFSADAKALEDSGQTAMFDKGIRTVLNFMTAGDGKSQSDWNNACQAYCEAAPNSIPFNLSTNPRDIGAYPGNLALAASFDPELAKSVADDLSRAYRAVGVTCLLGPQIDLCGEPRWSRITGAFGEDPALSRDLTRASIDGYQSTYVDGKDTGWGAQSVGTQMKHFPGDGAGESGRESHNDTGKYNVYPGGNFKASLVNFIDGGLNLADSTKQASGVMTSYSIAYSDDEEYGELVGSAYSDYKVSILRDTMGYDGLICSDWAVTEDPGGFMWTNWGVESLTVAERMQKIINTRMDQIGGGEDLDNLKLAYEQLVEEHGQEEADGKIRTAARHILATYLLPGLVENPYTSARAALDLLEGEELAANGRAAADKCVVMVKNEGEVICERTEKPKVYVPVKFTPAQAAGATGNAAHGAQMSVPISVERVADLLDVVTDTIAEPSGDPDENGQPTFQDSDLTRATAADVADCDFAVVFVDSPAPGDGAVTAEDGTVTYVPKTLQYRTYTADGANVREHSIAGAILEDGTKEDRGYKGQSWTAANEGDLDMILDTVELMAGKPVVVCVNMANPMVFSEFEDKVQGILVHFGAADVVLADILGGAVEPTALLPLQQPASMDVVEAQLEDVPRDMECHVDTAGNAYDFGFGLNWSGVIDDERVATYASADPLTEPETASI